MILEIIKMDLTFKIGAKVNKKERETCFRTNLDSDLS